jgi:cell volume regulation protein A
VTLDVHTLNQALLAGCGVLLVAILAVRGSVRVGLPSLLLYLLIGVGLGDAGLGVEFSDAELANALGFAALVVILAEGGLTTSWHEMRPVARLGASLATVGVAVSVGVMAVGAHVVFGMSWELAVLLGAVTSPTDAAAVFSVLRRVPLPRRITGMLEAESGFNDAPVVILVTALAARSADPADHAKFTRFYMRVWLLFFLEYLIVPVSCLAG